MCINLFLLWCFSTLRRRAGSTQEPEGEIDDEAGDDVDGGLLFFHGALCSSPDSGVSKRLGHQRDAFDYPKTFVHSESNMRYACRIKPGIKHSSCFVRSLQ